MDHAYDMEFHAVRMNAASLDEDAALERRNTARAMSRPSFMLRPRISRDGNQWCAMYGENPQEGVAGFGISPELAFEDFDRNWRKAT